MITDAFDDVGEPCLGLDAVEPTCTGQGVEERGGFSPLHGADEHPVPAPERDPAQGIFHQIVADLEPTVITVADHSLPAIERIATRTRQIAVRRQASVLGFEPDAQCLQLRHRLDLADASSLIRWRTLDIALDGEV